MFFLDNGKVDDQRFAGNRPKLESKRRRSPARTIADEPLDFYGLSAGYIPIGKGISHTWEVCRRKSFLIGLFFFVS